MALTRIAIAGLQGLEFVVAAILGFFIVLACSKNPRRAALLTLCLLPFMGGFRRLLSPGSVGLDPIVALPLITAALLAFFSLRGQLFNTPLSRCVLGYFFLVGFGAFNPLQHSLPLGVVAAVLAAVPGLWFVVGRGAFSDKEDLLRLAKGFSIAGALVALYGLKQQFLGFTGNEAAYIASRVNSSYSALSIGGFIRPFSTLSNGAEYGHVCSLAAIAALSAWRNPWLRFPLFGLCGVANFLAGSRGSFLLLIVAIFLYVAMQSKLSLPGCLAIGLLAVVSVNVVARALPQGDVVRAQATTGASAVVDRTVSGLAHPFNSQTSTVGLHRQGFLEAISQNKLDVVGNGPGSVSPAALTFHIPTKSGETDLSDLFVAYGYPGALLLVALIVAMAKAVQRSQDRLHLWAVLAPVLLLNGWFVAAEYSSNALFWVLLGALDASWIRAHPPAPASGPTTTQQGRRQERAVPRVAAA